MHPGREAGKRGEVAVHRRRRQALVGKVPLPRNGIAPQHRRDAVLPVSCGEEVAKALEVERDLAGDSFGAHPDDCQAKILRE